MGVLFTPQSFPQHYIIENCKAHCWKVVNYYYLKGGYLLKNVTFFN
jgi:hypothetical protein